MVFDLTNTIDELLQRAEAEPQRVVVEAQQLMQHCEITTRQVCIAGRAAGLAARQLGDFDRAREFFDITLAHADTQRELAGHTYLSRAGLSAIVGDFDVAFADLDRAEDYLPVEEVAHVTAQRAVIRHQAGELDDAIGLYDQAIDESSRDGHPVVEALARSNRSVLALHRGEYQIARSHLDRSKTLYEKLGHANGLLLIEHNLGYLATCEGRVVDALAHFEEYRTTSLAFDRPPFGASADRSHALLLAGLTDEARCEGIAAAEYFTTTGEAISASDAWVSAGHASVAGGDPARAVEYFARAIDLSGRSHRDVWRAIASVSLASASLAAGQIASDGAPGVLAGQPDHDLDSAIATLDGASMTDYAAAARITAARHAVAISDEAAANRRLRVLIESPRSVPLDLRPSYWLALAELGVLQGDLSATRRAISAGLRANGRFRLGLSGIEAISTIGPVGRQLGSLGISSCLAAGRRNPWALLHYLDVCHRSVRRLTPPSEQDPTTTQLRTRHQQALHELDERVRQGEPGEILDAALTRVREAERAAAMHNRTQPVIDPEAGVNSIASTRAMAERSDDRTLVVMGSTNGLALAVVVKAGRARIHEIGRQSDLLDEISHVRAVVRRCLSSRSKAPEVPATQLDEFLGRAVDDSAPVLIVAPAELSGVPWGVLRSLRPMDFTVAKSLLAHDQSQRSSVEATSRKGQLFVSGPNLFGATSEITQCAALYKESSDQVANVTVLTGERATADEIVAALDVQLAHLACHGSVRDDSPLFSSLLVGSGPLHLHDLAAAPDLPEVVVLSACDVGRTGMSAPTHALGLPDTLVAMGVGCVVASTIAIPDDIAVEVFVEFHKQLLHGRTPSESLCHVRTRGPAPRRLLASCFTAFGR